MWYAKNDDVIVFMRDDQGSVDPEILEKYFPQSYTQGRCFPHQWHIDYNTPYNLASGACVDGDDSEHNASRRHSFTLMFPPRKRTRRVSLLYMIMQSDETQVITYQRNSPEIPNVHRNVSLATQKRVMSLMNKSGYETLIGWHPVAHYLGGGVELHLTVSH